MLINQISKSKIAYLVFKWLKSNIKNQDFIVNLNNL